MAVRIPTVVPRSEVIDVEAAELDAFRKALPPVGHDAAQANLTATAEDELRAIFRPDRDAWWNQEPEPVPATSEADELRAFMDAGLSNLGGQQGEQEQPQPAEPSEPVRRTLDYLKGIGGQGGPDAPEAGGFADNGPQVHAEQGYGGSVVEHLPEDPTRPPVYENPMPAVLPSTVDEAGKRAVDSATGAAPDVPPLPPVMAGPLRGFPYLPGKDTQPPEDTKEKIREGRPLDAQDFASGLMKAAQNQGTSPAYADGMPGVRVGTDVGDAGAALVKADLTGEGLGSGRVGGHFGDRIAAATGDTGGLVDAGGYALGKPPKGQTAPILGPSGDVLKEVDVKPPKEITPDVEALAEGTGFPQKVPAWRVRLDRTRNVLASMGEAGQELAERVHKWRDDSEVMAAAFIRQMPTVAELKGRATVENLVDVLEGKAQPLNATVARAAAEAKGVLDDLYTTAQNAGVEVAGKIDNYFPHRFKGDVLDRITDRKEQAKIVEHLKRTGQAADDAEANQIMQRYVQAAADRRHGNLEMERIADLPGYEKTKEALYAHVLSASRRINEVAQFGHDDAIANRLMERIGAAGWPVELARDQFQTIVGAKPYDQWRSASALRQYNAFTRLGFAALSNATQFVNTASVIGVVRTAQAMGKAWRKDERDFADKAGVTLDTVMRELREGAGWSDRVIPGLNKSASDLAMPAFNEVETYNRRFTVVGGRDFAVDQARKAASGNLQARRALEAMGLDADAIARRGGKLTEREQIDAARSIVERTQFRVDAQDLPGWASSPWGRVVAQFQTFAYNQAAFLGRELWNEAKNGNVLPLVRYAILAPLANAAVTETRNALHGRDPEEDPGKRLIQYGVGTLGIPGSAARALLPINSDRLPAERQASMVAGAVLGPSLGLLTDAAGAAVNALRGNATPAARTALRQIPVVGTRLQNELLPYEKQQEAPVYALPGPATPPKPPAPPSPPKPPRR